MEEQKRLLKEQIDSKATANVRNNSQSITNDYETIKNNSMPNILNSIN